ncbi:fibrous sheath-interacting protein 1 isoform X2 [Hoplias malabaricus]|uniref:fibrous sheath-interacting protein 1 isoform X2 n=1 Tax=Hoplias malabaricus TaxID=27720 RepID=UPI003462567A
MDITKGSLHDINRPASSERYRAGSRVSNVSLSEVGRLSQDWSGSLEVLSQDNLVTQDQWNELDSNSDCPSDSLPPDQDVSDEENEDKDLQKAFKKMKILDRKLSMKIANEKEVKKQGRELYQRLWQELKDLKTNGAAECSDEAENTRLYLALTSSSSKSCSEGGAFVPVFETQVPDEESDLRLRNEEAGVHSESSGCVEEGQEVSQGKQTDCRQTSLGKSKHRQDFVKKNIELAGAGSLVLMTQEERERLEELLKDLEEDETPADPLAIPETDISLGTVPATSGFMPHPDELDQLLHIDARLQLLLPVERFLFVKSPCPDRILTQVRDGDRTGQCPAQENFQWDMNESRIENERLRQILQQLELLTLRQQNTPLDEEQLRTLLLECEMDVSRCSGSGPEDSSLSPYCNLDGQAMSLLATTPYLSSSALSQLLQETWSQWVQSLTRIVGGTAAACSI